MSEAEKYLAKIPSPTAPTVKRRAAETDAIAGAERLAAGKNRSGVRPIGDEVRAAAAAALSKSPSEEFLLDPSNAVTRVQPAVDLEAFLPPTVEVAVAVSPTIVVAGSPSELGPSPADRPPGDPAALLASGSAIGTATARFGIVEASTAPATAPLRAPLTRRRRLAVLLVAVVMASACALIVAVAVRRAHATFPDTVQRLLKGR